MSARSLLSAIVPSPLRPLARLAAAVVFALSATACGDDNATKKGPSTAIDPAEQARVDEGKKLIEGANRAMADRRYDEARKLLQKADALKNESQRFELEENFEKLDKRQAKLWANEVDEKVKSKDCMGVFKDLSAPIAKLESDAFARELRRLVGPDAQKCLQAAVDEKVIGSAYVDARKLIDAPEVKALLGANAVKKASAELEATILDALKGRIADDLKARKWTATMEKIDAATKKGDANDEQTAALLEMVREGVGAELAPLMGKALGQQDAAATLRQADALIKLVRWEAMAPDAAAVAGDKALPEALAKKHEALSIWVEAQRAGLKIIKTPEVRFAHGKVGVTPPGKIDAPSKRDIPHGTQVWILGTAKDKALVMDTDPGGAPLVQLLDKVIGYAPYARLFKENTIDWLVPDEQLKGERVWGPLRPPETVYELGLVTEVNGRDISVKRFADDQIFKLTRQKLRSGRLGAGTKVITFCVAKDQPAQVMELLPAGRGVKLKCDGGQEKEEVLPSLRSRAELLPTTK